MPDITVTDRTSPTICDNDFVRARLSVISARPTDGSDWYPGLVTVTTNILAALYNANMQAPMEFRVNRYSTFAKAEFGGKPDMGSAGRPIVNKEKAFPSRMAEKVTEWLIDMTENPKVGAAVLVLSGIVRKSKMGEFTPE